MTHAARQDRPIGEIRPARLHRLSIRDIAVIFGQRPFLCYQPVIDAAAILCSWDGCAGHGGYATRLAAEDPPPGVAPTNRDVLFVTFPRGFRCSSLGPEMIAAETDGRPWRGQWMMPGGTTRSYQLSRRATQSRRPGRARRRGPPDIDFFGLVPSGLVAAPSALLEPDRGGSLFARCPECDADPIAHWLEISWPAAIEALAAPVPQREMEVYSPQRKDA